MTVIDGGRALDSVPPVAAACDRGPSPQALEFARALARRDIARMMQATLTESPEREFKIRALD